MATIFHQGKAQGIVAVTLIYAATMFSATTIASPVYQPDRIDAEEKPGPMLAQSKKRKKKKKKRKKSSEEAGTSQSAAPTESAAPATGATADASHPEQESSGPYKWHVSLLSDFSQVSQQVGSSKSGSGKYELDALGLYIIGGSIEVGGGLSYSETTTKYKESSSKDSSMIIKLKGVYNFGNLQNDSSVFFAGLGLGFGSTSSKAGDADEAKSSITQFGLGLGMHYFVDSNVAFTGEFNYDTGTSKADGADEAAKITEIHFLKLGFSLFL